MAELITEPTTSSCCSPAAQETCCAPESKSECCGADNAGNGCGCAASRAEADELVHQLRQEAEAKRINERRAQSVREIEQSCRRYGWWFPQDRR